MTTPHAAISARGTTFVQNVGTPQEALVTKTQVPLLRRRLVSGTPEETVRVVNEIATDLETATLGSRSIPFGGPVVILEAVAFVQGASVQLSHRLGTARVAWMFADVNALTAGAPTASRTALDDKMLTLLPQGTFVADVVLTVKP